MHVVLAPLSGAGPLSPAERAISFGALSVSRRSRTLSRIPAASAAAVTPTLSITNASVTEGNLGQKTLAFTVALSGASASQVMVAYDMIAGTATSGMDFLPTSDLLTFAPGVTSQQINASVVGDTAVEPDETFTVRIYGAVGAALGTATATGTITNDDGVKALPTLTIDDISSVPEGNSGYSTANFTVTLSTASTTPVTVQYVTGSSSVFPSTAGVDYLAVTTPKTLTFNPGEIKKLATVSVIGDTTVESNERFTVTLSNPSGATIARGTANATITDDDRAASSPVVSLSPAAVSVTEGNSGTTKAIFTVALANGATATSDVTVNYATTAGGAKADKDFEAIPPTSPGSVTIPKGSNSATFYVRVIGDYDKESDETFTVSLTSASLATLGTAKTSTVTIRNDDQAGNSSPVVSIEGVSVDEGNSGTKNAAFTVSLSRSAAVPVTVKWTTGNGTATAGSDYTAGSGTLTFAAGVTSQTINVAVKGDNAMESDETFTVELYQPSDARLGTFTATGTIRNDEFPTVSLSPAAVSVTEGNSGTTKAVFTVSLSRAAASPVTVKWATNNGTATAGSDYTSAIGTLTFATGVTSQTFTVAVAGDTAVESDETFTVELVQPSGLTLGAANRATVTIKNDDTAAPAYTVSPSATTLNEGQTLTTTVSAGSSAAGTTLYWRVEQPTAGGGVRAEDFSSGALQGSGVLSRTTSGSQLSVSHTVSMDWSTVKPGTYPGEFALSPNPAEGNEQIQISFYSDPAFKNLVKSTPLITIKDTARSGGPEVLSVNTDWTGARFQKLTKDANGVYSVAYVDGTVTFTSKYYKYNGQGKEKTQVMLEQPWVPGRPTIVYAHGWKDSAGTNDPNSTSQLLFNALHERYGATHNILLVDWKALAADTSVNPPGYPIDWIATPQPTAEITVTKQVGETVARMLLDNNVDPAQLTLIGHSLGSYVMSAAASYIAVQTGTKVAKLVGLDPAFGVEYDIDARNGWGATGKTNNDPPIAFTTAIATTTRAYVASDLESAGKLAGDNKIAALAERSYLVQYTKTDFNLTDAVAAIAGYHNAVIAIYGDLVRKGIEDPPTFPIASGIWFVDKFSAYGGPGGPFDGVIVAAQPWVTDPKAFLAPKAIGWTNGYSGITIYGSPKGDVMYHDRFDKYPTGGTKFYGGDGDDFLVGDRPYDKLGIDELYGEKGRDTFVFGYRRYAENVLPYADKWRLDLLGSGLDSYAVIKDFNPKEDKLYLAISKAELLFRKAGDIDASLKARYGDGIGLLYANGDLFAYIPGLSYDAASAFLNSSKTSYFVQLDLDQALFQSYPRTSEFFG